MYTATSILIYLEEELSLFKHKSSNVLNGKSPIETEEIIYKQLSSKKFRKWAIPFSYKRQIQNILHDKVSNQQPLLFVCPFGGYKLWRFPTAPEADWAEFFSIAYILDYLIPIAAIYKPGIQLEFVSDAFMVSKLNDVVDEDLKRYTDSFKSLINLFHKNLPNNCKLAFTEIKNILDLSEILIFSKKNADFLLKEWEYLSLERKEKRKKMAILNMQPSVDSAKILRSILFHETYLRYPKRENYLRENGKIVLYNDPIANCIPIGSVKASRVKFWVGFGVLEKTHNGYIKRILSYSQLQKISGLEYEEYNIKILSLKNLQKIRVYKNSLDFS